MPKPETLAIDTCPLGVEFQGYWNLLSPDEKKFEFDAEALYSITVQELALQIARKLPGDHVLDAFCGAGGNAIAFARLGKHVTAIEMNEDRLEMAKHNAEKYGVSSLIDFQQGDALEYLQRANFDSVFLDPPWGGPAYTQLEKFPLEGFVPSGRELLSITLPSFKNVAFKLPDNFDFPSLDAFGRKYTIGEDNLHGRLLHYTAYFLE